jgi:hypothetical protein
MIYLSCHKRAYCFISFLENFQWILNKNGYETKIVFEIEQNDDLWVIIWNSLPILPRKCIIYNMDPMLDHIFNELKSLIQNSPKTNVLQIVNYCYGKTFNKIKELNLQCSVMPYGYSDYHKTIHASINDPTDILFYGNISPRRQKVLQQIYEFAVAKAYKLKIFNNNLYHTHDKIREIINSKIVISIASDDAKLFETNDLARSSQILSLGGFLITEYIGDTNVESKMEKYAPHFSTEKQLLYLLEYYLTHEEKRLEMIAKVKTEFKKDFDLEKDMLNVFNL